MKNKKFLTEGDDYTNLYNLAFIKFKQNNPSIKSPTNKNNFKISQRANHINNSFNTKGNITNNIPFKSNKVKNKEKENNFSKILKMLDEEVKNSTKYKFEINSLKISLNSKNKEIKILNHKINSLMTSISKLKKEKNIFKKNNQIFYQAFINMINNFKDLQNILNISLPTFSSKDSQVKKYQDILYTIDILIKSTINLYKNSNSSISKFNSLKNQINLFNDSFEKNTKKNMDKMTQLKMQNIQMKNILNQNISFLKELREENSILKTRNLNLEKNINLISKSRENLRNKILGPIKINYLNNNNSFVNRTYDNINNISINTTKTNKTTTDILIEEFQDKENKMQHLHEIANNLCNENKDIK